MIRKILLVDDDPVLLKTVGMTFHRAGYEVIVALNGPDAMRKVVEKQPDLVILDVMLPGMSGHEVCQHLRETPETEHLPIIMLSALSRVEDKIAGFSAGADDYLVKPISPEELLTRVKVLLARSAQRAAPPTPSQARIVAFIGVKGGVGTSTLAVNVAIAAAQENRPTVLIDLHPEGGTAAVQLGQVPRLSLSNLLEQEPDAIDAGAIDHCLLTHRTGLRVLPAPLSPTPRAHPLTTQHVESIINHLSTRADLLVLDLQPFLSEAACDILRRASRVVLVIESDSIAAQTAQRWLEALGSEGIAGSQVYVVAVNRGGGATPYNKPQLEEMLGSDVSLVIRHAVEMCLLANKNAMPVVLQQRNTNLEQQLRTLAEAVIK
jgi:pilus assembly protein CpaE